MPAGKAAKKDADGGGGGGKSNNKENATNPNNPAHRTTFRPPWVKEEKNASQTAPWTLNKRGSRCETDEGPVGKCKKRSQIEIKHN